MAKVTRSTKRSSDVMDSAPVSSAINIADEILKIAKRQGKTLTPMQLMKLVYISHGFALAVLGRDLFSDRIEAWRYGPVIPVLYQATKHFGRNEIPLDCIEADKPTSVDKNVQALLEDVFNKYGHLSAIDLSKLTHRLGTPWEQVYEDGVMNIEISDRLIRAHYESMLDEQHSSSAT